MVEDAPFYAWTILETWNWLINVPYLGLVFLVLLVLVGLFVMGFFVMLLGFLVEKPRS